MLTLKNIERDLDEMTMAQIKVYVEELKNTIYHMSDTMTMIHTSLEAVSKDIKSFSGVKDEPTQPRKFTKEYATQKNEEISMTPEEEVPEVEEEIEENEEMYILIFTIRDVEGVVDRIILGHDPLTDYCVHSDDPTLFAELESHTEYLPNYYFTGKTIPNSKEINNMWNVFKDYYKEHKETTLLSCERIDSNKHRYVLI